MAYRESCHSAPNSTTVLTHHQTTAMDAKLVNSPTQIAEPTLNCNPEQTDRMP
jgi:hypothetical protein